MILQYENITFPRQIREIHESQRVISLPAPEGKRSSPSNNRSTESQRMTPPPPPEGKNSSPPNNMPTESQRVRLSSEGKRSSPSNYRSTESSKSLLSPFFTSNDDPTIPNSYIGYLPQSHWENFL